MLVALDRKVNGVSGSGTTARAASSATASTEAWRGFLDAFGGDEARARAFADACERGA